MDRAIFAAASADAFAVLGVAGWITPQGGGAAAPVRAIVTNHDPEGIAPKSLDSAWVDLPAGAAQAGDLLTYRDTVDLQWRACLISGRADPDALGFRIRWVGTRFAMPEGTTWPPAAFPNAPWEGSDWVPRP